VGPGKVNKSEVDEIVHKFREFTETNKHLLDGIEKHNIMIRLTRNVSQGYNENSSVHITFTVNGDHSKKQNLIQFAKEADNFLHNIPKNILKEIEWEKNITHSPTKVDLKIGAECQQCTKALTKEIGKFICIACQREGNQNSTWCWDCAGKETDPVDAPFHAHPLLYIPPNGEEFLLSGNVKNLKDSYEKYDLTQPRFARVLTDKFLPYSCDNCGGSPKVYDWSCATCWEKVRGSYDLCDECFKISQDSTHEKFKDLKLVGEHSPSHPILRQPFNYEAGKGKPVVIERNRSNKSE